jgi:glycosyltransferase involved in cell wall biosynthesis
MNNSIAVVILTFNEEIHIERCIRSAQAVSDEIIVVDSFSTDNTCAIAQSMGAIVYQHKFENYARQINWAFENCDRLKSVTIHANINLIGEKAFKGCSALETFVMES